MRFAVSLIRLLCAIIAGAVLVAFLYFANLGEMYGSATTLCMIFFISALCIWGLVAIIGDLWLNKIANERIYKNVIGSGLEHKIAKNSESIDFSSLIEYIKQQNEENKQILLSELQATREKNENKEDSVLDKTTKISENILKLQSIIENLQNVVNVQGQALSGLFSGGKNDEVSSTYPKLTEEAGYPEAVIEYSNSEDAKVSSHDGDEYIGAETEDVNEVSYETERFDDEPLDVVLSEETDSAEVGEKDDILPEDVVTDEKVDIAAINEDVGLGTDNQFGTPVEALSEENTDISDAGAAVDLGADDPFGASVELTPAEDVDIITASEADDALDLGADDPFGAKVDANADIEVDTTFEPEHHTIDLGADNPFGTAVDVSSPVDIEAIEPTTNTKRNEPNLDHIFNEELASEIADLDILNDKENEEKDDLDLEQFFAGHRKSLG